MTPELTGAQLLALKTAILAEPAVAAYVAAGDDGSVALYYNGAHPTVKAWRNSMSATDLFTAMDVTKFDNITQSGKREAWRLLLDFAPVDFRKNKMRKAVTDVWGAVEAAPILTDCTRAATRAEALFGGDDKTDSGVTAKVLNNEGSLEGYEVGKALRG